MLQKVLDWVRGETAHESEWPECPLHGVQMEMFKKVGQPTNLTEQETETYTLLYRCPLDGCDEQATRRRIRSQIPVPGEQTPRPSWAERDRKTL